MSLHETNDLSLICALLQLRFLKWCFFLRLACGSGETLVQPPFFSVFLQLLAQARLWALGTSEEVSHF